MGDQARRDCVEIRESLASASADLVAIDAARGITSTHEIRFGREPPPRPLDCIKASPAQMRTLEKTIEDTKAQIPADDPNCAQTCANDLEKKAGG